MLPEKDAVKSPLHRLQTAIVKDLPFRGHDSHLTKRRGEQPAFDAESVYLFDSVSTNGRLLDRLDLESEDYVDDDDFLRRRESFASIQSSGRLLDRLGLEESGDEIVAYPARQRPITANSSSSLERMKSGVAFPQRTLSHSGRIPLKSAPYKVVLQRGGYSVDSLQGDISTSHSLSGSVTGSVTLSESMLHTPMGLERETVADPTSGSVYGSVGILASPGGTGSPSTIGSQRGKSLAIENSSSQSVVSAAPVQRQNSSKGSVFPLGPVGTLGSIGSLVSVGGSLSRMASINLPKNTSKGGQNSPRLASRNSSRPKEVTSLKGETSRVASGSLAGSISTQFFDPSCRFDSSLAAATRHALALRAEGNHREASYQLQITALPPNNYPRAMYLYAQALSRGQGVKTNMAQVVRWLCRCVLVAYILEATAIDTASLTNYVTKLNELVPADLVGLVQQNIADSADALDPQVLHDRFAEIPGAVAKMIANNSKDTNVVGGAYFQLAKLVLQGAGVAKDEDTARQLMAMAAAQGCGDAMVALGELWNTKSKHFKRDARVAAAWLRLGEMFGMKDIGNLWIYKEKYMKR